MKAIFCVLLLVLALTSAEGLRADKFSMDNLIEMLRGIFESWDVNKEEVDRLLLCVSDMKDIEHQVEKVMEDLKKLDLHDLAKLVETVSRLFGEVQSIFKDILPCVDSASEIKKLLDKIIHLKPSDFFTRLFHNLLNNGRQIYNGIIALIKAFSAADYYTFGYNIGDILELLFLKNPDLSAHH